MDAQGMMRLMFDTMDAYDRADFDRLAEIYAEDAQWLNADPDGPHGRNRDDIFTACSASAGAPDQDPVRRAALHPKPGPGDGTGSRLQRGGQRVQLPGRHITSVKDYPSMAAAEAALGGSRRPPTDRWWRRVWRRWRPRPRS